SADIHHLDPAHFAISQRRPTRWRAGSTIPRLAVTRATSCVARTSINLWLSRKWTELSSPASSLSHPCRSQILELRSASSNQGCGRLQDELLSRAFPRRPCKQHVG